MQILVLYFSLLFLKCTSEANLFSEYRLLVGIVNYSQNLHSLSLYLGILGAYLTTPTFDHSTLSSWFDRSILNAIDWLKKNNPYFSAMHIVN
ncbi:17264_t:CDS:2 [Cetraspora pellucida]|uniref:17264_t:CDS:1 n=1 Tax=Cetraspora pellucida TaxID=1433469 RepID=A0ACA9JW54_9GLOM|nr:17264_t:CDS:2 [Cetraspora pellucida]